jgi:hypothetical protein
MGGRESVGQLSDNEPGTADQHQTHEGPQQGYSSEIGPYTPPTPNDSFSRGTAQLVSARDTSAPNDSPAQQAAAQQAQILSGTDRRVQVTTDQVASASPAPVLGNSHKLEAAAISSPARTAR